MLQDLFQLLEPFYLKIVVSAIILFVGLISGQLLSRLIKKLLTEVQLDKMLNLATGISIKLESSIASITKYLIYFVFLLWALENLGLGSIILNILAAGVVVLIIIGLLLAIKDFVPNAVAGIFILFKKIVEKDDEVKIGTITGKVVEVELIETIIKTKSGDTIYVPNSNLIKENIVKK